MKLTWGILLVVAGPVMGWPQGADRSSDLLPVEREGAYGYVNRSGGNAIAPQFVLASRFSEGLAAVQVGEKWGYIDSTGAIRIQPSFASALSFSGGRAVVSVDRRGGTKYFYIDRTGTVMTQEYDGAEGFRQGLAVVRESGRSFFIDTSGKRPFEKEAEFDSADSFSGGFARVSVKGNQGYIDRTGQLVILAQFKSTRSFSDGLAAVQAADGLWGYIDERGTVRIKPQFESAKDFSEGLAPVRLPGDLKKKGFGFINKIGEFAVQPRFEDARSFSEGLAAVAIHDPYVPEQSAAGEEATNPTRWGFINGRGQLVIPHHFLTAEDFSGGVAYVIAAVTGWTYYIDRKGALVTAESDVPAFASMGVVNADVFVSLALESTPQGATVYLIPLFEWENDQNLSHEEDKLFMYRVADGVTPVTIKIPRETYQIVFKLDKKTEMVQKQVRQGERNVANIKFQ